MPEFAARNVFDAGALYASRGGGPGPLRKNLARVIGVAPADVPDEPDARVAGVLCPLLARGVPAAVDGSRALGRGSTKRSSGENTSMRRWPAGRGAVLALPHSGNWDMAGVWLAQTHGTFTTVAERLKPESLYRRFIDYRESLGFEVMPLSGGERPPFEVLGERLRDNRVVCLMAERDLTRTGVQVDFFGEPTRMPAGPAKLAIDDRRRAAAGALLVRGRRLPRLDFYPPLDCASGDVGVVTQALADHFANNIAAHPADWHMLQPQWLADLSGNAGPDWGPAAGASDRGSRASLMRIGMVCPYSFDVPGGVQSHVLQLAEVMRARGHDVSVLAPSSPHVSLPDYVVSAGRAVPIPYNGSVARLQFSPAVHGKVKSWLAEGEFDVLHLHEPNAPSLSMWALADRRGPDRGHLSHLDHQIADAVGVQGLLRPLHEKIVGRIAVSDLARRWQMEALGSDAVEIPNGVDVAAFAIGAAAGRLSAARQDGAVPGPLRRTPQGHGGAARRAAHAGRAVSRTCRC